MLDIGCGDDKTNGCIGYDMRPLPGVDVVGDARVLPFLDNSVDQIFCHHVIEHFIKSDARKLLQECLRVLTEGGVLYLACPDMESMARSYLRYIQEGNRTELERLTANYYGGYSLYEDYRSNQHLWGYNWQSLGKLMIDAGFADVLLLPRRDMHECYVEGVKE